MSETACQRWANKWAYSLALVRAMQDGFLLHMPTYLRSASDALANANLAQMQFALALVQENRKLYARGTHLAKGLIGACLNASREVKTARDALEQRSPFPAHTRDASTQDGSPGDTSGAENNSQAHAWQLCTMLTSSLQDLLQQMALEQPQALVSPKMWTLHGAQLQAALDGISDRLDLEDVQQRIAILSLEPLLQTVPVENWFDQEVVDLDVSWDQFLQLRVGAGLNLCLLRLWIALIFPQTRTSLSSPTSPMVPFDQRQAPRTSLSTGKYATKSTSSSHGLVLGIALARIEPL